MNEQEKGFFPQNSRKTIITYNNLRHYWGYMGVLNYYIDKTLKPISTNVMLKQKYMQYIKDNNFEVGDIICIDDTLYCPQYIF